MELESYSDSVQGNVASIREALQPPEGVDDQGPEIVDPEPEDGRLEAQVDDNFSRTAFAVLEASAELNAGGRGS
ncbi:MAG: hypothetical protein ABDH63_00785 [Candidatus Caldarchaeales archaeon]